MTERFFSLNAALMSRVTNSSAEEPGMADALKKLVCCMLLLALVGTASAGYGTAAMTDRGATANPPIAGVYHGDKGLLRVTGDPEKNNLALSGCYFPISNLPAYYICIMVCKLGGGGDTCAPSCEAALRVCE
jgi:hypothetical protein